MAARRQFVALLLILGCAVMTSGTAHAAANVLPRLPVPPEGQSYFGFTLRLWDTSDPAWGDTRQFHERAADSLANELGGKKPTLLTVWAGWQEAGGGQLRPFDSRAIDVIKVESVVGRSGFVALDWTLASTTAANGGVTTRDVASGSLDAYIRQYAREIKAYGRPILIRLFGGEFNGSWLYGVSPRANPSLTTEDFVAAWRRVVDIFRAEGADNASWAWVPNAVPAELVAWIDPNLASYYPGDEYVDWAGADAYDVGPPSWLDTPYAFAVAHGKPFYLAEWGIRHDGSTLSPPQQREWIEAMFDYIEAHPAIKAVNYFNYNNRLGGRVGIDPARAVSLYGGSVNYQSSVNDHDHRLLADSGAGFRTTFARRIGSPRYVSVATVSPATPRKVTAIATLTSLKTQQRLATVRWRGNTAASTYDVSIRRGAGAWINTAVRLRATTYRFRGKPGARASVRVRARDTAGTPGPWTTTRTVRFPAVRA